MGWLLIAFLACKEKPQPDNIWKVTVTGLGSVSGLGPECVDPEATEGYQETFEYSLFYTGSFVEIKIGEDVFATGQQRGCFVEYESAVYLEDADTNPLRWRISGRADVQQAAGSCDLSEDYDWEGTEVLTVIDSENEAIEANCVYEMSVTGYLVNQ